VQPSSKFEAASPPTQLVPSYLLTRAKLWTASHTMTTITAAVEANQALCNAYLAEATRWGTDHNTPGYHKAAEAIAACPTPVEQRDLGRLAGFYTHVGRAVLQMEQLKREGENMLFPPVWTDMIEHDGRILLAVDMLEQSLACGGKMYDVWCEMGCEEGEPEEAMDYYGDFAYEAQEWLLEAIKRKLAEQA
jgi:hypothetical protein